MTLIRVPPGCREEFEPSDRLAQRTIFEDAPDAIELGFEPLEGKFLPDDFKPGGARPGVDGAAALGFAVNSYWTAGSPSERFIQSVLLRAGQTASGGKGKSCWLSNRIMLSMVL